MDVSAWVDAWIDRNVKARVLDGRPDRVFRATLIKDISQLVSEVTASAAQPQKEKRSGPGNRSKPE